MLTWKPVGRPRLTTSLRNERRRIERSAILLILGALSVLGAGLADLYLHRGLEVTAAQVRLQPVGRAQGTNIDLRRFPTEDLQQVLEVVSAGRLTHVRQVFSWADIEPQQGTFDWERYDAIMAAATAAGVDVVATIADTPTWARAPEEAAFVDAPARSTAVFAAFCVAMRARYPELRYFQIGGALDDPDRWGGRAPLPDEYAALLTVASEAFRVGATDSYLVAADVSSTMESRESGRDVEAITSILGSPRVVQLVDIVAIIADGGDASPYDRRMSSDVRNLSRAILLREALLDVGYGDRPIWLTRLGWTGDGETAVSAERQADLVSAGLRRIRSEWAWVDLVLAWEFVPEEGAAPTGLSLVEGNAPTVVYAAYADFASSPFGRSATTGMNSANSPACEFTGSWPEQNLRRRLSRVSRDPEAVATCRFWGSGLSLVSRYSPSSGDAQFLIDGEPSGAWAVSSGWSVVPLSFEGEAPLDTAIPLATNLAEGPHTLTIRLAAADGEFVFGGIIVHDNRTMIWPVALLLIAGILALVLCLREVITIIAEYLDILQRRRGITLQPALPRLSTWEPAARLRGRR